MTNTVNLIPATQMRRIFKIGRNTEHKWQRDAALGFPSARYIRGRKFYVEAEIADFIASLPTDREAPLPASPAPDAA